jgi:threonyl-tRNA synthetase
MAVIGDKEVEGRGVALRSRADGELGFKTMDELVAWLEKESAEPRTYEIG